MDRTHMEYPRMDDILNSGMRKRSFASDSNGPEDKNIHDQIIKEVVQERKRTGLRTGFRFGYEVSKDNRCDRRV
ncbi:hypothetical protein DPMN_066871 [Dreissena polymorpha]|uniref:Uncharacterized protein n=1 Tax=Dreissena polymorpha TaxID=45954 RepID=A0A9D4BSE1_DREPO|nr:hypothetical protein DPMN_066871 [Dreissena polymorpha]